jgi:hypothetical protein
MGTMDDGSRLGRAWSVERVGKMFGIWRYLELWALTGTREIRCLVEMYAINAPGSVHCLLPFLSLQQPVVRKGSSASSLGRMASHHLHRPQFPSRHGSPVHLFVRLTLQLNNRLPSRCKRTESTNLRVRPTFQVVFSNTVSRLLWGETAENTL